MSEAGVKVSLSACTAFSVFITSLFFKHQNAMSCDVWSVQQKNRMHNIHIMGSAEHSKHNRENFKARERYKVSFVF